jgi:nucleoside-diphosphate-sugar epimerase
MKTILITGINGFLGSHLAKALSSHFNIVGLEYSIERLNRIEGYNFKVYASSEELKQIFTDNSIWSVVHTATIYKTDNSVSLDTLLKTNIMLPVKLYETAINNDCQLFINTDTFFNDPKYNYSYLPEYTLSKKQVLEWLIQINQVCKLINMKVHHMYGPDDNPNKFVPLIIKTLREKQDIIKLTKGTQKRDFIFINDVVSAYQTILANHHLLTDDYTNIEVGTGIARSVREFVEICRDLINPNTYLDFGALPQRDNEIEYACAENSILKSFGWTPEFDIYDGISLL